MMEFHKWFESLFEPFAEEAAGKAEFTWKHLISRKEGINQSLLIIGQIHEPVPQIAGINCTM